MTLKNKFAIVFGGSSGIGKATAERLAAEGASVAVVSSGNLAKAEAVASEIICKGGTARAYAADVRDQIAVEKVIAAVENELGPIDILVNSAGLYYPTPIGETKSDDYDRMLDVNLKGTFLTINAVAPRMKARERGWIVNVASIAGVRASSKYPLYSASKAAVIMLTKALGVALAPYGIHVNAIAPGNTATALNADERSDPANAEIMAAKAAATPSKRVYSPPEEMASAIYFLVKDEVAAMYGSTILLDEGLSNGI